MHTLAIIFCVHQDRVDSVEHENGIRATEQWASHEPLHCLSHSHLLKPGNYTKPLDVHLHNTGFTYMYTSSLSSIINTSSNFFSYKTQKHGYEVTAQYNAIMCTPVFVVVPNVDIQVRDVF